MPANTRELKARFDQARARRGNWESHWQEIADLVLPTRDFTVEREPGEKRRDRQFDSTAPLANESLAAALHGLMTNPATRWFSLTTEDFDTDTPDHVTEYLYDGTTRMLSYLSSTASNFGVAVNECYQDHCAFGTAVMQRTPSRTGLLRFVPRPLVDFYLQGDEMEEVIESHRKFSETAFELVRMFNKPGDNLPQRILDKADLDSKQHEKFTVIHAVYRRLGRDIRRNNGMNKPWASVYYLQKDSHVIREGGFNENPYLISRWSKAPREIYGRSPAMTVLPNIKLINGMQRTVLVAAEQAVHPPLNVPANGLEGPIRTAPGSVNYYKTGTNQFAAPLLTGVNPKLGHELIDRVKATIEKAFFLDALKLPELDRMTAEEVITRRQQGLLMASPVLSRLQAELLRPVIISTFQWMRRTKRLQAPPPELRGVKIDFQGPLAQSQKATETGAMLTALQSSIPLINVDPGVMRNVDQDLAFRAIWELSNAMPTVLRPLEEVKAERKAQAEQASMAAQAEIAGVAAGAAKDAAAAGRDVGGG